jgi:hypothetical protein
MTNKEAVYGYFAEDENAVDAYLELNAEEIRLAIEELCESGQLVQTADMDFVIA